MLSTLKKMLYVIELLHSWYLRNTYNDNNTDYYEFYTKLKFIEFKWP